MHIQVTPKQHKFLDATAGEILYGGAAGGGKSYAQLIDALLYALKYQGSKQLILRRTFPELERSLIRGALDLYPKEDEAGRKLYSYNQARHVLTFGNGSVIEFGYCDTDTAVTQYQSAEYDVIRLDEATHFSEFQYTYLMSRLRGANAFPKMMKCSTNPGGVGHEFFKARFVNAAPWDKEFRVVTTGADGRPIEQTRIFIPAKLQDNIFLMSKDPGYLDRLSNLSEHDRRQLLDGSWDSYEGLYFPEFSRDVHVEQPFEIPSEWRRYVVLDYGLDMLACYWIALDPQDRAHVYREIYQPDLVISVAAEWIKERTPPSEYISAYLAPKDLWNRRQETGRSVADIFRESGLYLTRAPNRRIPGLMALKEALKIFSDEQGIPCAGLRIFSDCVNLIRCLAAIQTDKKDPSDVADAPHELTHAVDAMRYFFASRKAGVEEAGPETPEERTARQEFAAFTSNMMYDVYGEGGSFSW